MIITITVIVTIIVNSSSILMLIGFVLYYPTLHVFTFSEAPRSEMVSASQRARS